MTTGNHIADGDYSRHIRGERDMDDEIYSDDSKSTPEKYRSMLLVRLLKYQHLDKPCYPIYARWTQLILNQLKTK